MSREIGALVGDYRLIGIIGSGASGEVFQAEHVITRRIEAIKFLAHSTPGTPEEEQGFLREIEVQASLQHPNIAAVHNACRTPEGLALVMEMIDGEPLSAILARGGILLRDGVRYVVQTLDALAYAHDRGVVHRDVKPGNIVVARDGSVKLTDFGLAQPLADRQLTGSGTLAGSPYYMSPEQVVGLSPADARSDCYSVGVILYEIAAGRRPFEGESAFDVMLQQREAVPAPPVRLAPQIGAGLNAVILKAIEKDPARRFQSAGEFRTALQRALASPPAMRASGAVHPNRLGKRRSIAAAMVGLAGAIALTGSLHRAPAPMRLPPANVQILSQPLAPAVVPANAGPEDTNPPDAIATAAEPAMLPAAEGHRAARKKAAGRKKSVLRARLRPDEDTTVPVGLQHEPRPEPEPTAVADVFPARPAVPEAEPVSQPAQAGQQTEADQHEATPPQSVKRQSFLRRVLGRLVHPRSGKLDADSSSRARPANVQPEHQ